MSLIISNIALHFLSKQEETGEVILRLGPESITIGQKIENFVFRSTINQYVII